MARRIVALLIVLGLAACGESSLSPSATVPPTTTQPAPVATTSEAPGTTTVPAPTTSTTLPATTTTTNTTDSPVTAVDVIVSGGTVEKVETFDVPLDGPVRLTVEADVSDEIHLHGYDLHADVSPGTPAVIEFEATIPGIFEIELEKSGELIAELRVAP